MPASLPLHAAESVAKYDEILKLKKVQMSSFGEMYNLEKRSGENWIPMPYNREYEEGEAIQVFSVVSYRYAPHTTNSNVNYTQLYRLKFDNGIYRLTKNFSVDTATGWSNDSISVVFEIR